MTRRLWCCRVRPGRCAAGNEMWGACLACMARGMWLGRVQWPGVAKALQRGHNREHRLCGLSVVGLRVSVDVCRRGAVLRAMLFTTVKKTDANGFWQAELGARASSTCVGSDERVLLYSCGNAQDIPNTQTLPWCNAGRVR